MKILARSNFDDEAVSEFFVATAVNDYFGAILVKCLNDHAGEYSIYCYELVNDDHKLYTWEP